MHTDKQITQKFNGLKTYLEMQKGSYLTQDKIDNCIQFVTELEAELKASKNSSWLSTQNLV